MTSAGKSVAPLVTIGLPVYNGGQFLATALDSLLGQTFTDFELIISDNASTDTTEEICREYARADARVRYRRSSENRGFTWNANRVVELAAGKFFRWAAHDDACLPTFLERCVETLRSESPSVVLAYPRSKVIDDAWCRPLGTLGQARPPGFDTPQALVTTCSQSTQYGHLDLWAHADECSPPNAWPWGVPVSRLRTSGGTGPSRRVS